MKILFGILQIIPWNLKISAEARVVAGVLRSSLKFFLEIFWEESVHDLMGHNGTIKHDKLLSAKKIMRPFVFNPGRFDYGDGPVLKTLKGFLFFVFERRPQTTSAYSM